MNFDYSQKSLNLQDRLNNFIKEYIIPIEDENLAFHDNPENIWKRFPKTDLLKQKAKE